MAARQVHGVGGGACPVGWGISSRRVSGVAESGVKAVVMGSPGAVFELLPAEENGIIGRAGWKRARGEAEVVDSNGCRANDIEHRPRRSKTWSWRRGS